MVYHVQYDVQEPILLEAVNTTDDFEILQIQLPQELTSFPGRLLLNIEDELVTSQQPIQVFHNRMRPLPKEFFKLAFETLVTFQGSKPCTVLDDETKWYKLTRGMIKKRQLVSNLTKSTVP